ncbi:peptide ABC transporter substrate-binding protein [Bifidobacterium sp.]|jgi:oligopeptide transport system substrate-binding protein|uniref:peptide ABC transporter substrate-binding protein n=1 Tax=Bifidobacterium sp. TaxID=41200 RepID=UPI0025C6408B|nr:ABC transporter substrate-binding protein [Bifidobacterium sp.]MCH4209461.1 ABC transporter substrate-binding protein [Bifidobacterium sp.]MCI1225124.1 ABC transporter substrate-binding protein [Bifidobacterium sp.]
MKKPLTHIAAAAVLPILLLLSGCGSPGSGSGDASAPKIITFGSGEPANPLVPGNTNESGGGIVISHVLWTGLVTTKADGTLINEVADKITPNSDNTLFDITLKKGWKFTDGTPVTAQSFTKAWSYTANATNAQKNAGFFSIIKGYDALQKSGISGDEQLSGLKVISDSHFTVELNSPTSIFPTMLTYMGFYPMPEAFFKDPKGFGEKPIGNGPYKFKSWDHSREIDVVRNPDYHGYYKAKNDGITYKIYTDPQAQYADVQAGNLDVSTNIPTAAISTFLTDNTVKGYSKPGGARVALGISQKYAHFTGEEGRLRRAAISMSINRKQITEKVLHGAATPSKDFSAPVINGYSDSLKGGDVLEYNAAKAKQLWAQANAISPWSGEFEISYNADGPNFRDVYNAVANQIKNTLGIKAIANGMPTKQEYLTAGSAGKLTAAFHDNWGPDYPSIENYLKPIYSTDAANTGSNFGDYRNPEFDTLLTQAAKASSTEAANKLYQQAEEILLRDLPSMPLYNVNAVAVTTKDISSLEFDWGGSPVLPFVEKQ